MLSFLIKTVLISLSGVMAPGAVTAATLVQGSKNRWAGSWIAIGHGILEIPLIFILILGFGTFLENDIAKVIIGLIGGSFLVYLGIMTIRELFLPAPCGSAARTSEPVFTGFMLSATNPLFLFWWATVGLGLAMQAKELGSVAIGIFAIVHWSLDLIWLTILSLAAFHGKAILGAKSQKCILIFCGALMVYFGILFLQDSLKTILNWVLLAYKP